jgi:choline dehydrogenase-like flavoprotein
MAQAGNNEKYDVILVGTGFASSFFLLEYLRLAQKPSRILVLERGQIRSHEWQLDNRKRESEIDQSFTNRTPDKKWNFSLDFGGGSNCWWACTPRMLPEDFQLHSKYGVGSDWPLTYEDLEEYYCRAEEIMAVSGAQDGTPFPRSRPYPQPPHRFSNVDRLLKKAFPDQFFIQPTARPTQNVGSRPACCASGVCGLCPIDSKFTVLNSLMHLYEQPNVRLMTGATVQAIDIANSTATGVSFLKDGREARADGDLIVLGANAIFNPFILQRSGLAHRLLGKRLSEQVSVNVRVYLNGVDNFNGSTSITGHGYMLYAGQHRADRAAALIETWNMPMIRDVRGRWRQVVYLKVIFEDVPQETNFVRMGSDDPARPEVVFRGHSSYAQRGLDSLPSQLTRVLEPLPVEEITIKEKPNTTESHVIGTTVMGNDSEQSIVDKNLVHHRVRNLVVLGSSCFPTASPANPTLTICALSLRSANELAG